MNVLFVCTGNTCRSPMAAALFNYKWSKKGVAKSVGLFAAPGQSASKHVIDILTKEGFDSSHQSSLISKEKMDWATHVFTMTESHKEWLLKQYPQDADKIYTLKEFVNPSIEDKDVADPFGGDRQTYERTFAELKTLIDQLFNK